MIFHQPNNSLGNYNYNTRFYTDTIWEFHFHRNLELIYVISGAVNCTVKGVSYRLEQGDFGLCLPYEIHKYMPEENTNYWVLVFSEDFVRSFSKQIAGKAGDGFRFCVKKTTENYIKEQLIENNAPSVFTLKSCLYALCEAYLSSVTLKEDTMKKTETIDRITDYIANNHTKKITLSDVSRALGYDYNYMSRVFQKTFHLSFTQFLNIYRLDTAVKLLEETDDAITTVAFESGFQSIRSFNHLFKTNTGFSPKEYRKAYRT